MPTFGSPFTFRSQVPRGRISQQDLIAAQLLRQGSSTRPVQSEVEGIARALTGIGGGFFAGQERRRREDREGAFNKSLVDALGATSSPASDTANPTIEGTGVGTVPQKTRAQILAGNPDTAALGLQFQLSQEQQDQALRALDASRQREDIQLEAANVREDVIREDEQTQALELEAAKERNRLALADRPKTDEQQQQAIERAQAGRPLAQMPFAAVNAQAAHIEAQSTAKGIEVDLGSILGDVETGSIDLGLFSNWISQGRNLAGLSTEQSRNFASFAASLEKLRNDSLRLNNGVQTEGDAQRAMNELFASLNDNKLVIQRLKEIGRINRRAAKLRELQVNVIRGNYGLEPFDFSQIDLTPTVGAAAGDRDAPPSGFKVRKVR